MRAVRPAAGRSRQKNPYDDVQREAGGSRADCRGQLGRKIAGCHRFDPVASHTPPIAQSLRQVNQASELRPLSRGFEEVSVLSLEGICLVLGVR